MTNLSVFLLQWNGDSLQNASSCIEYFFCFVEACLVCSYYPLETHVKLHTQDYSFCALRYGFSLQDLHTLVHDHQKWCRK